MNYRVFKSVNLILLFVVLGCNPSKEKKPIALTELTISDIHSAYEKGQFNSQELVSAYIKQIEKYDKNINSISIINPEAFL